MKSILRCIVSAAVIVLTLLVVGPAVRADGSAAHGEQLYQGCQDCHSMDTNDVGPMHKGVFGRKAGAVPDYGYSAALKNSGIVWTEANLDKWLAGPQDFIPGSKMFYHLDNAQDRADVIEYLKERAK